MLEQFDMASRERRRTMSVVWLAVVGLVLVTGQVTGQDITRDRTKIGSRIDTKNNYISGGGRFHHRLSSLQKQRTCHDPPLETRQQQADVIFTGTVRDLEDDNQHPGTQRARIELKRVIKGDSQVRRTCPRHGVCRVTVSMGTLMGPASHLSNNAGVQLLYSAPL